MSWLKRIFDGRHRRARAAEGAGNWRHAASIWVEVGEHEHAAEALIHLAERGGNLEARLEAWHDALRWIPEDDEERRDQVEVRMGRAVLEEARQRGVAGTEEKRRLADAAERLERLDHPREAAVAFMLLERKRDQARCLELAGEVEALEELLSETNAADERESQLRRLLSDYESALKYGARLEARNALRGAVRAAPDERSVAELLRRLEARMPPASRVRIAFGGQRVSFVGCLPAVIGRGDVAVPIRGTSVSRRHAEIALVEDGLIIRDLDSRNGTLVRGVPISSELRLFGATEVGLGDDVTLAITPSERSLVIDVRGGLDRGERIVVGEGPLSVDGLAATITFDSGWGVLAADAGTPLELEGQTCALPVHLLIEDRLSLGPVDVEVLE